MRYFIDFYTLKKGQKTNERKITNKNNPISSLLISIKNQSIGSESLFEMTKQLKIKKYTQLDIYY